MDRTQPLDAVINRITAQPFRAKFHLRAREVSMVRTRGMATVRRHAAELIAARLAPAHPRNDGRQTPWGGHPVFRAQHATATCCRGCLARNHGVESGRALTPAERDYVVDVICRWVERECPPSDQTWSFQDQMSSPRSDTSAPPSS